MKTTLLSIITMAVITFSVHAEEAPELIQKQCDTILAATQDNDIEKFVSFFDGERKSSMTPEILATVSARLSPLMKAGYTKTYLGVLDKVAYKTYYWKVDFDRNGIPDMLLQLSSAGDKVVGFIIQ